MSNEKDIAGFFNNRSEELEKAIADITESLGDRGLPIVEGLPELTDEMRNHLTKNLLYLNASCFIVLRDLATIEDLEKSRDSFSRVYTLLKLIAVSSINLLDAPSPSVQELDTNQPFEVKTDQSTFIVF